jgi:hypothetical protein
MKNIIIISAILSLLAIACNKKEEHTGYVQKIDSVKEIQKMSQSQIDLKYSTYIVIKERIFKDIDGKKNVKMVTELVNKTDKDILCIKGWIIVKDDYSSEEFCKFFVDCPKDIPKNSRISYTTKEYLCDDSVVMHRKLLAMPVDEFNSWVTWDVEEIKFSDGTRISKKNL